VSRTAQSYSRAGLVLAVVLAADQLAKRLVIADVAKGDSNGVFSGKPVVMVIVAAALVGLVVWFALHAGRPLVWLPTGLLLGGALGNIIDRVRDGAVTDFIKLPLWPAFNLADVAITLGVLALLVVLEQRDAPDDAG
jgi:signal peptidase II